MTEIQHAGWKCRKLISTIIFCGLLVAVTALAYGLQKAQDRSEAAAAKARLWQNVIEHIPTAIVATNEEGDIIAWNNGATKLFGWEEKEIVGSSTAFLMPSDELRDIHRKLWADEELRNGLFEGDVLEMATDAMCKDGTTIRVKGKVTGAQNAHKSFVLLFYPDKYGAEKKLYISGDVSQVQPEPKHIELKRYE